MRKLVTPALVLVVVLLLAAPALAGKPGKRGPSIEHPAGVTCVEAENANEDIVEWAADGTGFTVTLNNKDRACVDVVAAPGETWNISVTLGSARDVAVMVKDAGPGDFCWGTEITKVDRAYIAYLSPGENPGGCFGDEYTDSDPEQLVFGAIYRGTKSLATPVVIEVAIP